MKKLILILSLFAFVFGTDANQDLEAMYEEAKNYTLNDNYEKRNYEKGFELYNKACELGHAKSCDGVGYGYRNGWGTDENPQKSIPFFAKACELGYGDSCFHLGIVYSGEEEGAKIDEKKAFEYFLKACDIKGGHACVVVAGMYEKGQGVAKDLNKAKELYKERCEDKEFTHVDACASLGKIYFDEKNYTKAKELFDLVLTKEVNWSSVIPLGQMYEKGLGVEKDLLKASEYYGLFCQGTGDGCKDCCDDYNRVKKVLNKEILAKGTAVEKASIYKEQGNMKKALGILEKSCNKNDFDACVRIGFFYDTGDGVKKNINKALKYYKKACDNNNIVGCSNMAVLYVNLDENKEIERDIDKASEYFKKGCDLGDGLSCRNLGNIAKNEFIKDGETISLDDIIEDEEKAEIYYKKACDLDEVGGCYFLGNVEKEKGNVDDALKLYSKACEGLVDAACDEMKKIYEIRGQEKNDLKADLSQDELIKLCDNGNLAACENLGILYSTDLKDIKKANEFLQKACDGFYGHSCWILGSNIEENSCKVDKSNCNKVLGLYKKACALGSQLGCRYSMSVQSGMPWMRF